MPPEQNTIDIDISTSKGIESKGSMSAHNSLREGALETLYSDLSTKFKEYSSARQTKEDEWINALRQYQGLTNKIGDKKLRALGWDTNTAVPPSVNITRKNANISIARLQDLQYPSGNKYNFELAPTPIPQLEVLVSNETVGVEAQSLLSEAKDKAYRMKAEIADILTESNFAAKSREAIQDLGVLGTAVMKGPTLQRKVKRVYKRVPTSDGAGVRKLVFKTKIVPDIQRVDPRLFYPDPNARPGVPMEDAFEIHLMTKNDLRKLTKNKAYDKNKIRLLLDEDPDSKDITESIQNLSLVQTGKGVDNRYVVKEYHGPIDKEVLLVLDMLDQSQVDDSLVSREGEVWFCQGQVIRISLSHLEGDDSTPYAVAVWEPDESSMFGHGVPYLMRDAQRVLNSAWLMVLENSGLTSGPQVVINKEMIEPAIASEGYEIAPLKVWFMTEYGENVNEAIQFVDIPANIDKLSQVVEMSMQFADIESATPLMQQGELPQGQNTTSGIAMIMSAQSIVQKKASQSWDDNIVLKIIPRTYHYVMQYGSNDEVKGDFEISAGGATDRIDAQIKAQDIERVLSLAGSSDEFALQIDANAGFRELVSTTRAGDILRTKQEVDAEQQRLAEEAENQPPDPDTVTAQAKMLQAQTDEKRLQVESKLRVKELQVREQVEANRFRKDILDTQARREENQIKLAIEQMRRELTLIKIAGEQQKTVAQIEKDLLISKVSEQTKRLTATLNFSKFELELEHARTVGEGRGI